MADEFTFEGREITITFEGKPYEVRLEKSRYKNGQLAIYGVNPDDGEIFAELTIQIPNLTNPDNTIYVWECILHKNFIDALRNSGWFIIAKTVHYSEEIMGHMEIWSPIAEEQNVKKQCLSKWICPLCQYTIKGLNFIEISVIGIPKCKNCDVLMDFDDEYVE